MNSLAKHDIPELDPELKSITSFQLISSLALPFLCIGLYLVFASLRWWPFAVLALMALSFFTYGSISHDLVHRNLGLRPFLNDTLLSLIELLCLRSGHAYRLAHLHHHACFPDPGDIEGAAAKMSFLSSLWEGVLFQFKIGAWALSRARGRMRCLIIVECFGCAAIVAAGILLCPLTPILLIYVVLMIMGSWIIPLITSYMTHDATGANVFFQTRLFRGKIASMIALEHLYHLEHHLYPSVPHHNWPKLAKKLDPFFEQIGIRPIKIWF